MSFGALVAVALLVLATVVLNVFFRYSTTFGSTYGPLAGIIALALWAYGTAIAFLVGAALAAQLEAVRASAGAPRSATKIAESEPQVATSTPRARHHCARPVDDDGDRLPRRRRRGAHRDPPARARGHRWACPPRRATRSRSCATASEIFPAMLDSISAARRTVDFLTFVYWQGEDREEVRTGSRGARRARGACACAAGRLWREHDRESPLDEMGAAGVQLQWFRPLTRLQVNKANHRTHRKVLVVDEEIAFTGGVGIADEWDGDARDEREWRDTHFRIRGPAVDGLRAAFLNSWAEADDTLFDPPNRPIPRPAPAGLDRHPVRARRLDRPGGATSPPCSAPCSGSPRSECASRPPTSFPTTA